MCIRDRNIDGDPNVIATRGIGLLWGVEVKDDATAGAITARAVSYTHLPLDAIDSGVITNPEDIMMAKLRESDLIKLIDSKLSKLEKHVLDEYLTCLLYTSISRLSLRLHKLAHLFVVFVCLLVILCDSKGLYEKIKHAVTYICK